MDSVFTLQPAEFRRFVPLTPSSAAHTGLVYNKSECCDQQQVAIPKHTIFAPRGFKDIPVGIPSGSWVTVSRRLYGAFSSRGEFAPVLGLRVSSDAG